MLRIILFFILFLFTKNSIVAQITLAEIPYSYQFKLNPITDFIIMPELNVSEMKANMYPAGLTRIKTREFAKKFSTDYHPFNSGEWADTPNGGRVWRLGIQSDNAFSLYLVFGKFRLEKGVTLFVYDPQFSKIAGPITANKNNIRNILPVAPIAGNQIIVELDIAPGITNFGDIDLTQVWHDYRNEFGNPNLKIHQSALSIACNININCPTGNLWQTEKKAICKIIANGDLCTGTMIGNVRGDKIPYLLTAHHCIENDEIASSAIFYFDYENTTCNSSSYTSPKIIEGATLLATTPNQLDFSLLRLNYFPPATYNVYMAGWEINTDNPEKYKTLGGTCIHHPEGDVKKISGYTDTLLTCDFGEGYNTNSHWLVKRWDYGDTEGGSSGAPLFNKNHRIIGTLTGGEATCSNPINDYFTKILLNWNYYPEKSKQLQAWLDPDNSGITKWNGYNLYDPYDISYDTIWNIYPTENITVSKSNLSWGYISGQNSNNWQQFAEKFNSTDTILFDEICMKAAKAFCGNALSTIRIIIWTGDSIPEKEIFSKPIFIRDIQTNAVNSIYLDTTLQINGTFFIGYLVNYTEPADTFALYHAPSRVDTLSTMFIQKNNNWWNIKDITDNYKTSLGIGYIACKKTLKFVDKPIKIYPNPCSSYVIADIQNQIDKINFHCYDISGKSQHVPYVIDGSKVILDTRNLPQGLYLLTINTQYKKYTGKFLVIRQN